MTHSRAVPASRSGRALLIGPVLVAAVLMAISAYLTGVFDGDWSGAESVWVALVYLYNVLPSLALAGLILLTSRRMMKGMPAVTVGTVVFAAFNLLGSGRTVGCRVRPYGAILR